MRSGDNNLTSVSKDMKCRMRCHDHKLNKCTNLKWEGHGLFQGTIGKGKSCAVVQFVEALGYKPEGRGFDSR